MVVFGAEIRAEWVDLDDEMGLKWVCLGAEVGVKWVNFGAEMGVNISNAIYFLSKEPPTNH